MKKINQITNLSLALLFIPISFLFSTSNYTTCLMGGDNDGDGYTVEQGDCDDTNPAIHPYALETCDGKDEDCDGEIDEVSFKAYENITVSLDANGEKIITPSDLMSEFNFPCGMGEIKIRPNIVRCSDIGTGLARIKVQSADGTEYSATINMTVIDNLAPNISPFWGNHFSLGHGTGDPTRLIISAHEIASYNDNCGILSTSLSRNEFTCSDIGWQWVELMVEDNSHNISREWILIDVQSTGPVASCHTYVYLALSNSGTANVTPEILNAASYSPCGLDLYMIPSGGPLTVNCSHLYDTILYNLEIVEFGSWKTASCYTYVIVTDPLNSCNWSRTKNKESNTSVNLDFYPNPVEDILNIEWQNNKSEFSSLLIKDLQGKTLFETSNFDNRNNSLNLDMKYYLPGMYFIQLIQGKEVISTKKFIKK